MAEGTVGRRSDASYILLGANLRGLCARLTRGIPQKGLFSIEVNHRGAPAEHSTHDVARCRWDDVVAGDAPHSDGTRFRGISSLARGGRALKRVHYLSDQEIAADV